MAEPNRGDVEALLTEEDFDTSQNPELSVGDTTILRTDRSADSLPIYRQGGEGATEVTLGEMIAEAGDTAVYLGKQHNMRRTVAVRTVHPERHGPETPGRVLSEGLMLGALEHPNIIPVYGIGKDERGFPLILMKHLDAVPWSRVLATPGHSHGAPEDVDGLGFEISRLIEVCRALEHAHERSIVHRDVKPSKVLIGGDGAVYLDGWSLAATLEPDRARRFPLASKQAQIAGTPAYMAPELAAKQPHLVSERTDVYLAAATLHHVVTGRPRHAGDNVFDALYSASVSAPVAYGDAVPSELGEILNRAMARDPAERYPSMAAFRTALQAFVDSRRELGGGPGSPHVRVPQAKVVPRQVEPSDEAQARAFFMLFVVLSWSLFGVFFQVVDAIDDITVTLPSLMVAATVLWTLIFLVALVFGKGLRKDLSHRLLVGPIFVVFITSVALQIGALVSDAPLVELVTDHLLLFFVAAAMLSASFDLRLVITAAAYCAGLLLAYGVPEYVYLWLGLSNLFGLGGAGYLVHRRLVTERS